MFNKGRRPWNRGPKKRYSVYKAEDNLESEDDYEEWARTMALNKGYDLAHFFAHDVDQNKFWEETYHRMVDHWKRKNDWYAEQEKYYEQHPTSNQ